MRRSTGERGGDQGKEEIDICPPLLGTHVAVPAVVGMRFGFSSEGCFEGSLNLLNAEALESALMRDHRILLCDGLLRGEQGSKGVEAKKKVSLPHHPARSCSAWSRSVWRCVMQDAMKNREVR